MYDLHFTINLPSVWPEQKPAELPPPEQNPFAATQAAWLNAARVMWGLPPLEQSK